MWETTQVWMSQLQLNVCAQYASQKESLRSDRIVQARPARSFYIRNCISKHIQKDSVLFYILYSAHTKFQLTIFALRQAEVTQIEKKSSLLDHL